MAPRLIRRAPLRERIQAYLNPLDFLLWLSEEVDANDWEDFHRRYSTSIGLGLNLVFLIARANQGRRGPLLGRGTADDVFGDDVFAGGSQGSGWFSWFVCLLFIFSSLRRSSHIGSSS